MTINATTSITKQNISHIWKTTIQKNIQGEEKRTALYTWPRIRLENLLQLKEDSSRRFIHSSLFTDLHNIWSFPIINDKTELTSQAASGQPDIYVTETDYRHFYAGRKVILLTAWDIYAVMTISSIVSSTKIILTENLASTWQAGIKVYPFYDCRIASPQEVFIKTKNYNLLNLLADESFESLRSFEYTIPSSSAIVYDGLDVFMNKPIIRGLSAKYAHPYDLTKYYGLQYAISTFGDTQISYPKTFVLNTKSEIQDLLNFFDSKQGRLKTFYLPTWTRDVIPSAAISAADTSITVDYIYLPSADIIGRHIMFYFSDGDFAYREITGRPNNTTIQLDSAVGKDVLLSELPDLLVCFLFISRFDVDEIALQYMKQDLVKVSLNFQELEK